MPETLRQVEDIPASYPAVTGLSTAAAAFDPAPIWQRLEGYVARRWTARNVVWTVEGAGEWTPPLSPATIATVEQWQGGAWAAVTTPPASPMGGLELASDGPWRITATVGAGTPPAAVLEAFRRLAEYLVDAKTYGGWHGRPGAAGANFSTGDLSQSFDRNPAWVAKAMVNSGAGDLLRPYRGTA